MSSAASTRSAFASCATNVALEPLRARRDDDLVAERDRDAPVVRGDPRDRVGPRQLALAPRDRGAGGDPLTRGHRLVELVDAPEERAELELPERLAQLCPVGRSEDELRRVAIELEIAPHRREHLRRPRLLRELRQVLPARRRQLLDVLEHALERPVLRDELPGGLVPDARDARNVVGGVALEPDEVRDLVGPDPVARLDALRRVDVDVAHAARRHHQPDVLRDELERVAVGRDDARPDPLLVGARRERGDHVVGLPALELEVPIAERLDDRPEVRELLGSRSGIGRRPSL